ncbi:MAG: hypothetical protein HFJ51_05080, partial [Clostridia bacterium]|nr:hypothetical protein [Clostridia bacterium]
VYGANPTANTSTTGASGNLSSNAGSSAALSSSTLGFSDILNIILIVIGVLLILFAIAILIRLR